MLTQTELLVAMRTPSPQDRDAVKAWLSAHDVAEVAEVMNSLPSLATGEAWISSPYFLGTLKRIQFRTRHTFDSSSTPKVGEARRQVRTMADIDLAAIKEQMAETIERAKADDPKELRRRIVQLERQLGAVEKSRPAPEVRVEHIEVPVLDEQLVIRLEEALSPAVGLMSEVQERLRWETTQTDQAITFERKLAERAPTKSIIDGRSSTTNVAMRDRSRRPIPARKDSGQDPRPIGNTDDVSLKAGARKIVEVLARHHPMKFTRSQVGTLTGFKITGGTFQTYWGQIKRAGLVEEHAGEISVTAAGLDYAGVTEPDPMTTDELLDVWRRALKKGAREMLDVLVEHYPSGLTRDELAECVGMTASGGTFQTYLGQLRRNGLAETDGGEVVASETLFITGVR